MEAFQILVGNGKKRHLNALLELAKRKDLKEVYIHLVLDFKDETNKDGVIEIEKLNQIIKEKRVGKLATIMGSDYVMNTDLNSVNLNSGKSILAYEAICGKGNFASNYINEIEKQYLEAKTNFDILPITICDDKKNAISKLNEGDTILIFNHNVNNINNFSKFLKEKTKNKVEIITMLKNPEYKINGILETNLNSALVDKIVENQIKTLVMYNQINQENLKNLIYYNGKCLLNTNQFDNINYIITSNKKTEEYLENIQESILNEIMLLNSMINRNEYQLIIFTLSNLNQIVQIGSLNEVKSGLEAFDLGIGLLEKEVLKNDYKLVITSVNGKIEEYVNFKDR